MGLFRTGPSPAELALSALQAENTDLRSQLRSERAQFETERLQLIDRLMALTNHLALREVRRTPQGEGESPIPSPPRRTTSRLPPYPPRQTDPPPSPESHN